MSSSRTLSRKFRTFFTCIKPRFDPSIILLYIAASVEQYCDITQLNALPENEGILEPQTMSQIMFRRNRPNQRPPPPSDLLLETSSRVRSIPVILSWNSNASAGGSFDRETTMVVGRR